MWVCLIVGALPEESLRAEVAALFGPSYGGLVEVPDQAVPDETYVFVRCLGEIPPLDIRRFQGIRRVLPNAENPSILSDDEVEAFVGSCPKPEVSVVSRGDVVMVEEGELAGLTGVVAEAGAARARVFFRLHTKSFSRWVDVAWLKVRDNFFRHVRFPVLAGKGELDGGQVGRAPD